MFKPNRKKTTAKLETLHARTERAIELAEGILAFIGGALNLLQALQPAEPKTKPAIAETKKVTAAETTA